MKPIQYPITQIQQVSGVNTQTVREFRGLNTFDAISIDESFFTDTSNLDSSQFPAVVTRPGYSVLGSFGTKVLGLASWKGVELHAIFNDGTWRKYDGSQWTTLKSNLDTSSAMWSFTNFLGNWSDVNLVGCNGVDGLHRYDGVKVEKFGDAPDTINYVTTYQNRLWGADEKELLSSALDQPEEWALFNNNQQDSYGKVIESTRGENINMLSGGLSKLIIGLPNSILELYGGMPSDFADVRVTEDAGVINNRAAVTLNGQLTFMHKNGIFEYGGGTLPSNEFYKIIGNYPITLNDVVAAGTDGEKLYYQTDNALLVYDTRSNVRTWNVWHGFKATCFLMFKGDLYAGDIAGRVIKIAGKADESTQWQATTKPFNNQTIAQRTRWYRLWIVAEISAGSSLQVHLSNSINGDDWELVQAVTGNGLGVQKVLIPVGKYALENCVRVKVSGTGHVKIYDMTRQTRAMPMQ